MKVVCLVPADHFHAPVVLSALAEIEGVRLLTILTPKIPGRGWIPGRIVRLVRESGWDYLLSMAGMKAGFWIHSRLESRSARPPSSRHFLNVPEAARLSAIPSLRVRDINGAEAETAIRTFSPDLILSIFFNQIIRPRIIRLAGEALNVHPSPLPAYRGVSPAFWILKNGAPKGGASIHRLTEKVDTGEILLRAEVPVQPGDTVFQLYRRSAIAAADLLRRHAEALAAGEVPPLRIDGESPSRFGKITPQSMKEFRRTGRRFFRLLRPLG